MGVCVQVKGEDNQPRNWSRESHFLVRIIFCELYFLQTLYAEDKLFFCKVIFFTSSPARCHFIYLETSMKLLGRWG